MTYQKCPICGKSKCHGGDKNLAAKHSKINQARLLLLPKQERLKFRFIGIKTGSLFATIYMTVVKDVDL